MLSGGDKKKRTLRGDITGHPDKSNMSLSVVHCTESPLKPFIPDSNLPVGAETPLPHRTSQLSASATFLLIEPVA